MLLPYSSALLAGCACGGSCGPCASRGMHGLGATPSIGLQPDVGESDAAFRARMRAADTRPSITIKPPPAYSNTAQAAAAQRQQQALALRQQQAAETTAKARAFREAAEARRGFRTTSGGAIGRAAKSGEPGTDDGPDLGSMIGGAIGGAGGEGEAPADGGSGFFPLSAGANMALGTAAAGGASIAAGGIMHASALDRARSNKTIKRKQQQSIISGAGGGAASGAAMGTMILPGWGTLIGGAAGAIAGAAGGFLGTKKLAKQNRKLRQQELGAAEEERRLAIEEQQIALEEQRQAMAEISNTRLRMNAMVREADRWLITVRNLRGDAQGATMLRDEVVALRAEAAVSTDWDELAILEEQALESVSMIRELADMAQRAATPAGLSGMGSDDFIREARRANRAALGLPPQEEPAVLPGVLKVAAAVAIGGFLLSRSR